MTRSVVIIGGGIVGSSLSAYLSENDGLMVTVLDAGPPQRLVGSTGHAPGFHGLLSEAAVATELARASADEYEQIRYGGHVALTSSPRRSGPGPPVRAPSSSMRRASPRSRRTPTG